MKTKRVERLPLLPDWRIQKFYVTNEPCCVCGRTWMTGIEPRFNYVVCEEHSTLSPVEISRLRK
jgi:hypothetical protein